MGEHQHNVHGGTQSSNGTSFQSLPLFPSHPYLHSKDTIRYTRCNLLTPYPGRNSKQTLRSALNPRSAQTKRPRAGRHVEHCRRAMHTKLHPGETLLQGVLGRTQQHTHGAMPINNDLMKSELEKWDSSITTSSGTLPCWNTNRGTNRGKEITCRGRN